MCDYLFVVIGVHFLIVIRPFHMCLHAFKVMFR